MLGKKMFWTCTIPAIHSSMILNASKARTADRSLKTQRIQGVFRNGGWKNRGNTVRYCWWKKSGDHQLRLVVLSQNSQGFIHPRWLNHQQYHSAQKQTAGIHGTKKRLDNIDNCVGEWGLQNLQGKFQGLENQQSSTSWWFQPIWKILVKMETFPR